MKKYYIYSMFVISCFININFSNAFESFTDFPKNEAAYDIQAAKSPLGNNYVKIKAYFGKIVDEHLYVALYKEYDRYLNFIGFKQTQYQGIPEFHIQTYSTNYYDVCILLLDKEGKILARSVIERVSPSEFFKKEKKIQEYIPESVRKRRARSTGLELSLEIDSYKFPIIDLTTEVKQNGVSFDGDDLPYLEISNFEVTEDSRHQVLRELVPPQPTGYTKIADIVFVHDDSGSLSDEAAQVSANIQTFVDQLNDSGIDYRVGLVPYGGSGTSFAFSQPDGIILHNGFLHNQGSKLISDIGDMKFYGGTEQAFCAIKKAIQNILWRPSAQKVIILVTDEDNDLTATGWPCIVDQNDLIDLLKDTNTIVYTLHSTGDYNSNNDFLPLSQETNGKSYLITENFTPILNEIGADIAAKYLLQYQTDNTEVDTSKIVTLTATYGTNSASATETYIPSPLTIIRTPETIALSNSGQRKESELTIVAKITQYNTSFNALLFFKNSTSSYLSITMNPIGNDLYSANIPYNYVIPKYIHYYISVNNGTITTTLPSTDPSDKPFIIPVLPNMPPIIEHTEVTSAYEDQDIEISALVEDVTDSISKVELYYRKQGESVYSVNSINPGNTKYLLESIIPASKVTKNGLEYYLYAEDNYGVSTYKGTPDNPIQITVSGQIVVSGYKDIGNIRIFAASITQQNTDLWIASGDVVIGTVAGNNKLLHTKTSLNLHYDSMTVDCISENDLYALDIKRTSDHTPENIHIYYGNFVIDCDANTPFLTYSGGESRLKLIQNILFLFPVNGGGNTITINDDNIILNNIYTVIEDGINATIEIGNITLSQIGNTTDVVTVSGGALNNSYKLKGSKWTLSNLEFIIDISNENFSGKGDFQIPQVIEDSRGGIETNFSFINDPLSLEKISGQMAYPRSWRQLLYIPPNNPIRVFITDPIKSIFSVDKISSGNRQKLTGNCEMKIVDALNIIENVETINRVAPIFGENYITIDKSNSIELSGSFKFMGYFDIDAGKIKIKRKGTLEGDILIPNIAYQSSDNSIGRANGNLSGHVKMKVNAPTGEFMMTGKNSLTLTFPADNGWVAEGYEFEDRFDTKIRCNSQGIQSAEFIAQCWHRFTSLWLRVDFSNPSQPVLKIQNFLEFIFSHVRKKGRSARSLQQETFSLNQEVDELVVKIFSENNSADFSITLPDSTVLYETAMNPPVYQDGYGYYFFDIPDVHTSYYAIQNPPQGDYIVEVKNAPDLGDYRTALFGPNAEPEISVQTPSSNITWDQVSDINITWTDEDVDDNAIISLFYDDDNEDNNGVLIADNIEEDYTTDSYSWTVGNDIQTGSYYIYARIDDSVNGPIFSYSTGKIFIVNPLAPATPSSVTAIGGDGAMNVQWDANPESDLSGYRVYLSDTPGSDTYKYNFGVGISTSYDIEGLTNGTTYEVAVSSINYSGLESQLSNAISALVTGTNDQGSPDLTVDVDNSGITSTTGKLEGVLTIKARIMNLAPHESYSGRVSCYYGKISESNKIDSTLIGSINAYSEVNYYQDVYFQIDSDSVSDINDLKNIYIDIDDVVLTELDTDNNTGIILNSLPFDHTITLRQGLNLISFPNLPSDSSINTILNPILDKVISVLVFNNSSWSFFDPLNITEESLATMEPGKGYYIKMREAANLTISGTLSHRSLFLDSGWNLVGFNSIVENNITDVLTSIDGKYLRIWAFIDGSWKVYDPNYPDYSSLKVFKPGYGYFIAISDSCTWTIP